VEGGQGGALFGYQENARGLPIQTMGQFQELGLGALLAQGLDHSERHPTPPVDRDSGWLVDDHQGVILVKHGQVSLERLTSHLFAGFFRLAGGETHGRETHQVPGLQAIGSRDPAAVNADFAATQDAVNVAFRNAFANAEEVII